MSYLSIFLPDLIPVNQDFICTKKWSELQSFLLQLLTFIASLVCLALISTRSIWFFIFLCGALQLHLWMFLYGNKILIITLLLVTAKSVIKIPLFFSLKTMWTHIGVKSSTCTWFKVEITKYYFSVWLCKVLIS